ncbi:MAG: hypothetical protein Kow00121_64690 [Elainellaceae cyanobacterium]
MPPAWGWNPHAPSTPMELAVLAVVDLFAQISFISDIFEKLKPLKHPAKLLNNALKAATFEK